MAAECEGWTEPHAIEGIPCGIPPGHLEHQGVPRYHDNHKDVLRLLKLLDVEEQRVLVYFVRTIDNIVCDSSRCDTFDLMTASDETLLRAFLMVKNKLRIYPSDTTL
jgi:hypothetical protein